MKDEIDIEIDSNGLTLLKAITGKIPPLVNLGKWNIYKIEGFFYLFYGDEFACHSTSWRNKNALIKRNDIVVTKTLQEMLDSVSKIMTRERN